jgi:hypothetical protein
LHEGDCSRRLWRKKLVDIYAQTGEVFLQERLWKFRKM